MGIYSKSVDTKTPHACDFLVDDSFGHHSVRIVVESYTPPSQHDRYAESVNFDIEVLSTHDDYECCCSREDAAESLGIDLDSHDVCHVDDLPDSILEDIDEHIIEHCRCNDSKLTFNATLRWNVDDAEFACYISGEYDSQESMPYGDMCLHGDWGLDTDTYWIGRDEFRHDELTRECESTIYSECESLATSIRDKRIEQHGRIAA